jgi:hypothetical protein
MDDTEVVPPFARTRGIREWGRVGLCPGRLPIGFFNGIDFQVLAFRK